MDFASANGHTDAPLSKASGNGHIHVLDWWWRRAGRLSTPKSERWSGFLKRCSGYSAPIINMAMKEALYKNHVHILERWKRLIVDAHADVPGTSTCGGRATTQESSEAPPPPPSWWADCGFAGNGWAHVADFGKASNNGALEAMRWWATHKLPFAHSPAGIDSACMIGNVALLDWWLYESGLEPLYTERALDLASVRGDLAVLDWWRRSGLPLKYNYDTLIGGQASDKKGVASWWNADDLPPLAPPYSSWPMRLVNSIINGGEE
ncbi:hypothetical protein AMAG_09984 [Allomyces macrogynus ATCC 38327]|uniref:Uncharacterized protein n=1 Tax=Allomyces macrogynus (strain ATCC 38327) TaxID=578462 RepID=A0A0L0SQH7_ALLM3|nr:hypothetical protein AMAG_09984 [Allomyces macrogynus ATCC 38327]|eukprot:KNE64629.1 hypothetical protein AMAG_09984 [Allomyces macrogynus ATCC 38327]